MKVQLEQVRQSSFRWDEVQHIPIERLERSEVLGLGDIAWRGEIRYAAPGFHLKASVAYEQQLRCVRCLQPMTRQVASELELMIFLEQAEASPGEYELEASDLGVLYLETGILDLEPLLMEQLQLDVPMRETCREDCKGLCPDCGANRNVDACECSREVVDPRWSGLADLKGRLES